MTLNIQQCIIPAEDTTLQQKYISYQIKTYLCGNSQTLIN